MRGQREGYLQAFNDQRGNIRQTGHQSQERIKKESEYLRVQRENFLNGFSADPSAMPNF